MINFGEFLPDQPAFKNRGATEVKNVIPALSGYRVFKTQSAVSGAADNKIIGMFSGKDDSANAALYAADSTKIYLFNAADSTLVNKSKSGNYTTSSDDRWRFVQFGEKVICTNFDDPIQIAQQVGQGAVFADLGGSPPKAKFIAVVRDQVMTGHTNDSSDGVKPYRLWWSGVNDEDYWTPGTSLSDFQDIPDVGDCTGLVGGEYAIALFEKAIVRGNFVGSPLVYTFQKLSTSVGCSTSGSVAAIGSSQVFWLGDDGFYMLVGDQIKAIGAEKINRWFLDRFKIDSKENMVSGIDPRTQNVIWSYPNSESTDGENNEILIYNYRLDRWSYVSEGTTSISSLMTAGYTLDTLDNINSSIDALPASLDDGIYKGGVFFFAGAKDKKVQSFSGASLDATIETTEFEVAKGQRSVINNLIPYITCGSSELQTITAQIGSRQRQIDQPVFSASSSLNADGYIPVRSLGAFHRVRINLTGDWEIARGVDIDAKAQGFR